MVQYSCLVLICILYNSFLTGNHRPHQQRNKIMTKIPPEIQLAAQSIVDDFNSKIQPRATQYLLRFKGAYLYLDRSDYGERPSEICRLEFTGSMNHWDFAITNTAVTNTIQTRDFSLVSNFLMERLKPPCGVDWLLIRCDGAVNSAVV